MNEFLVTQFVNVLFHELLTVFRMWEKKKRIKSIEKPPCAKSFFFFENEMIRKCWTEWFMRMSEFHITWRLSLYIYRDIGCGTFQETTRALELTEEWPQRLQPQPEGQNQLDTSLDHPDFSSLDT